jgi:cytochrome c oxidase subunit 2
VSTALILGLWLALFLAGSPLTAEESGELADRGMRLFMENGCYGCHTIGKTGTPIAPDLSRVGLKRSEAYLLDWLRDPRAQKPTAHMPRIALTEAEARALAAYLSSLR